MCYSTKNIEAMAVSKDKTVNVVIGTGYSISATIGAIAIEILAQKLAMPIAVTENSVGNIFA